MKRCQKCNKTFPDDNQKFCTIDGGLLVSAEQAFDPNATIQSSSANMGLPVAPPSREDTVDLNATIATNSTAETAVLPRPTGPTGGATIPNDPARPQPAQTTPTASQPTPSQPKSPQASLPPAHAPAKPLPELRDIPLPPVQPKKKSKLPLILGVLALLLVLAVAAVVALFFLVIKPRLDAAPGDQTEVTQTQPELADENNNNTNATTAETPAPATVAEYVPPPDTTRFENSQANLDGKLAEHYFDFSFYYPSGWHVDPKAGVSGASNFAKVERRLPPDFTQENFAVGWYTSKGTVEADGPTYPQLVELLGANLAKGFPGYRKVSEGPTRINSLDGYEFRFVSKSVGTEKGDIDLWGRVVFLPTGVSGDQAGATLIMLATSLAPELSGVEDVGEKGEMPVILESFRFGKKS